MLHGICVGEEAGARNLVFFRVEWLQAAMKGTSCVRRVRLQSFRGQIASPLVFCNLWMQNALQWLHGCVGVAAKRIVMAA